MRTKNLFLMIALSLPGMALTAEPQLWGPAHTKVTVDTSWYVAPKLRYATYITDPSLLAADKITPDNASQYLYDRPRALYQLYMLTGDERWKQHASAASKFYLSHIGENGYFDLVGKKDIKYLMPKGLLMHYQFSADENARKAIARIYRASLDWSPEYQNNGIWGTGFWTERNQAAALDAAVTMYELTADEQVRRRIESILQATEKMTLQPENNWPTRGCPQHSFKAHEGGSDNSAVCSPWMLALLADPIWRYQQATQSALATSLLQAFGRFIVESATYQGTDKFAGQIIPKYLVVFDNAQLEDINPWNDSQHSCDVAALLAKSLYVSENVSENSKKVLQGLLGPCKAKADRLNDNKPYWRVRPARKFGWEYSTTSELPWLEYILLNKNK